MTVEFSTFGSCASRNIFSSVTNKNYKQFFHINNSVEMVTLISLMSNPIEFNPTSINSQNNYDNVCVIEDLSKKYLNFIKSANIDYIVFDTYFDVHANSILINEDTIITDTPRLWNTDFYNNVKDYPRINIVDNYDYYLELWKKSWNNFFEFIQKNNKGIKIILNCSRAVYDYCKDGNIFNDVNLIKEVPLHHNKYRNILDSYILNNFDVECLPFNECLLDSNHIFGLHPTHYEPAFYDEKNHQLNSIIRRNNILSYNDEINLKFRHMERELTCMNFK